MMATNAQVILDQVEELYLDCQRGYRGMISMTRAEYDTKKAEINKCEVYLRGLLGEKATFYIKQTKMVANMVLDIEIEREERMKRREQLKYKRKQYTRGVQC
jgi:hypothetical protein